jgi:putative endonuclease
MGREVNIAAKIRATIRGRLAGAADYIDGALDWLPWRKRLSFGRRGENLAARHLRRRGYRILVRNFRAAGAEIDLVAMERETLVFVEVKARQGPSMGEPAEAVDARKRERIRRAAEVYASVRRVENPIRFDVVAISGIGRARKLELLKDAF